MRFSSTRSTSIVEVSFFLYALPLQQPGTIATIIFTLQLRRIYSLNMPPGIVRVDRFPKLFGNLKVG